MSGVLLSAMQSKRLGMTSKSLLVLLCMCAFSFESSVAFGQAEDCEVQKRKLHTAWLEASQSHQTVKANSLRDEYFEVQRRCHRPAPALKGAGFGEETFYIDRLKIIRDSQYDSSCASGAKHHFTLIGVIGPDSTFAMRKLLDRYSGCRTASGELSIPITVSLHSAGGVLDDGYSLGNFFRDEKVNTVVENGEACASSCAVAFLGGTKRIVEDNGVIMYHAPYFTGENAYGKRDINCEVGEEALNELNAYYREMTDAETGDRLFERSMWYCSAEDGWVVKGGSAAELLESQRRNKYENYSFIGCSYGDGFSFTRLPI